MCTLLGAVTGRYTPTVTCTAHKHKPTHSLLIALAAYSIGKMTYSKECGNTGGVGEVGGINGSFGNIWVHNQYLPPSN